MGISTVVVVPDAGSAYAGAPKTMPAEKAMTMAVQTRCLIEWFMSSTFVCTAAGRTPPVSPLCGVRDRTPTGLPPWTASTPTSPGTIRATGRRQPAKWYGQTMLATIDAGGRVVVPKEIRERLGLRPGSRIVLTEVEGRLEISPATTPVRLVDHEGTLVAVADTDLPVLTADQVRDAVEAARR